MAAMAAWNALATVLLLLAQSAGLCGAAAASGRDAAALVQGAVRVHHSLEEDVSAEVAQLEKMLTAVREEEGAVRRREVPQLEVPVTGPVSKAVTDTPEGPMAYTKLGPILGVRSDGYTIFRGIPYKEQTGRFEVGEPKRPWAPATFNATKYRAACIGAHVGLVESEDCLYMNIWMPNARHHTNMPVIIYIHGGINQHGGGHEGLRHGDGIVQVEGKPTIFINFDFRLGIFGWISLANSGVPHNLGMQDQQEVMAWVNRHISAFGGDPNRVTLLGQSEGCAAVLNHVVAPGSKGLFQRVVLSSPVADIWPVDVNKERTNFMIARSNCNRSKVESTLRCLKRKHGKALWQSDWVAEELSRGMFNIPFWNALSGVAGYFLGHGFSQTATGLGWHAEVDGATMPGVPRELIRKGQWNKVPVLITTSKNETIGCLGGPLTMLLKLFMRTVFKKGDVQRVKHLYNESLVAGGDHTLSETDLHHKILTDKIWTCDIRTLASDIELGGGQAFVGGYWHNNGFDPVGRGTNARCERDAACHAGDMPYILPQRRGAGVLDHGSAEEVAFMNTYSSAFLSFVHGGSHPWKRFDVKTKPFTLFDSNGTWVVPNYRHEQCDVLDSSTNELMPATMGI